MQSHSLKFILVGDSRVGKSQLARRFTKNIFDDDLQATVGLEFSSKTIQFERCEITARLFDTAGQERAAKLSRVYYNDARGAILVYDICKRSSFESITNLWLPELRNYAMPNFRIILVGNKYDMVEEDHNTREVSVQEAIKLAERENLDFIETSALTGNCVEAMFRRIILSAAELLEPVKVHLDCSGLPRGWMEKEPDEPPPSPTELSTLCAGSPEITTPKADDLRSNSTAARRGSQRQGISLSKSTYVNYWTGEETATKPTSPAPPKLLYQYSEKAAEEVAESIRRSLEGMPATERSSSARTISLQVEQSTANKPKNRKCLCLLL